MNTETTVLLAPGRRDLGEQLLKIGCKVREENRGYMPVMIAVRAFSLSGLWVDAVALRLNDEQVSRLRSECVINSVRIVVAGDKGGYDNVRNLALYLAGIKSEHTVIW